MLDQTNKIERRMTIINDTIIEKQLKQHITTQ